VQHYVWGGTEFIPHWLGIENTEQKPFAEYWMGAHPTASSTIIIDNKEEHLFELIKQQPDLFIGEKTNKKNLANCPIFLKYLM